MTHTSRVWSWFFQRITALFLLFGMIVHFMVGHYLRAEGAVTFQQVAERLTSPCWVVFDILLLIAAVWHGWNGLWQIHLDLHPGKVAKQIWGWLYVITGILAVGIGVWILIPLAQG